MNQAVIVNRLPPWFRQEFPDTEALSLMHLLREFQVHTVCQEAKCPNISRCFRNREVTFLLLGNECSRHCRFCNAGTTIEPASLRVPKGRSNHVFEIASSAASQPPRNDNYGTLSLIIRIVKMLGLDYVVLTSVSRDDLSDGGAGMFAEAIRQIRRLDKEVEALIPDFQGEVSSLKLVLDACPSVLAHNIETVVRLYDDLRPEEDYQRSLGILAKAKELKSDILTKSSMMLGLGETEDEVIKAMQDLRQPNCDILTLGQYLAPSPKHYPVKEFISPEQFRKYQQTGEAMGFKAVLAGPLVRSSYKAREIFEAVSNSRKRLNVNS